MTRHVTTLCSFLSMLLLALPALAQPMQVTVREINALPADSLTKLNALGTAVTAAHVDAPNNGAGLVFNDLLGAEVQFTGVLLNNPRNSGLSTPDATTGNPSRVHIFVRDTSAAALGNEGMTIQVVDGSWEVNGTHNLIVGDVIEVVGTVSPFFATMQVAPTSITLLGRYDQDPFNLPATILDPVELSGTDEVNSPVGAGTVLPNWDNWGSLRGQYVSIQGAKVIDRDASTTRPDFTVSTDDGQSFLNFYDSSLRFRNDRGGYNDEIFNVLEDDFIPPPIGALVNIRGFLVFNDGDDPFNRSAADNGDNIIISINPWEDGDLEITVSPPTIGFATITEVPGTDPATITFDVTPDPTRTVVSVELKYTTSAATDTMTVDATNTTGTTWTADIPAGNEGDFVTYWVVAEDSEGGITTSSNRATRFLADGINSIEDIQLTADGGPGNSPFQDFSGTIDLTAVVVSNPSVSAGTGGTGFGGGFGIAIQDDDQLEPWSGIIIDNQEAYINDLAVGDQIHITSATVEEENGVTQLDDLTYEKTGQVDPYAYKVVATGDLQDENIAEAHEGMRIRFENVTVLRAATDGSPYFGELLFASEGDTDGTEADDESSALEEDWGDMLFMDNDVVSFIQGIWWYSFGEYKLVPESVADIGEITDIEDEAVPGSFTLHQNFPNPFNPTTTIRYDLSQSTQVTLEVYDALGRRVATLVDGFVAAGEYTATFSAKDLASGLYLYRLATGDRVTMKKMVLLK